jgi:hypothetical protein
MVPFLLQKPRSSASISGTCRVNAKGTTESDRKPVATVTVKTKEKKHASIISNAA